MINMMDMTDTTDTTDTTVATDTSTQGGLGNDPVLLHCRIDHG